MTTTETGTVTRLDSELVDVSVATTGRRTMAPGRVTAHVEAPGMSLRMQVDDPSVWRIGTTVTITVDGPQEDQ